MAHWRHAHVMLACWRRTLAHGASVVPPRVQGIDLLGWMFLLLAEKLVSANVSCQVH